MKEIIKFFLTHTIAFVLGGTITLLWVMSQAEDCWDTETYYVCKWK